jgi:hypothetical protein
MMSFPTERFLLCLGAATPIAIAISVAGDLMEWSNGLSFAVLTLAGTLTAMTALYGHPRAWLRDRR